MIVFEKESFQRAAEHYFMASIAKLRSIFEQGPYKFQLQTTRSFVEQYYCWPFLGLDLFVFMEMFVGTGSGEQICPCPP